MKRRVRGMNLYSKYSKIWQTGARTCRWRWSTEVNGGWWNPSLCKKNKNNDKIRTWTCWTKYKSFSISITQKNETLIVVGFFDMWWCVLSSQPISKFQQQFIASPWGQRCITHFKQFETFSWRLMNLQLKLLDEIHVSHGPSDIESIVLTEHLVTYVQNLGCNQLLYKGAYVHFHVILSW